jgi:glycosyltransferase involved in cell wall biosynthesis
MSERVLTLFLSNGKSLRWWQQEGLFSREMALYLRFLHDGTFDRVQIFSYDAGDRAFVEEIAKQDESFRRIEILAPAKGAMAGAKGLVWGLVGPFRHRRALARSRAIKTNQINGSWAAILASRLTGRPLILRMGYRLSRNYAKSGYRLRARFARAVERAGFGAARHLLVSARDLKDELDRDPAARGKVVLTPTYVDMARFEAKPDYRFDEPLIAVGRMTKPKNLHNLLRACALARKDLVLVGQGELEAELRILADELPIRVEFAGQVPNEALAAKLREHSVFILPSLYEGLPKALVEAMASGLVCIGSHIPGITDLIVDGVTGYFIEGFEPEAIAAAIERAHSERHAEIGRRARAAVEEIFGLDLYVAREAALYAAIDR